MRPLLALLGALAALAWSVPAVAAIGTPTSLGTASAAASGGTGTLVITTGADCPPGSLAVVIADGEGSIATTTVADSAGNSYTAGTTYAFPSNRLRFYWSIIGTDLPSSGTITTTYALDTGKKYATASCVSGVASADLDGGASGTTGASTAPSITTATLNNANEIIYAVVQVVTGVSDTYTEDAGNGWTTLNSVSLATSGKMHVAYKIVAATTAKTYAPTLGTSRTWGESYQTFTAATTGSTPRMMLMGVGP